MGAAVWRFAPSPVPVDQEPAVDCGGGWWRIANGGKRLWHPDGDVAAEAHEDAGWQAAEVAEVEPLAGRLRVEGRPGRVRLSVAFLPLTAVAVASRWALNLDLAVPSAGLGGSRGASKLIGSVCELGGVDLAGELGSGPYLVELETRGGAYYAIGTTAISEGDVLRVTVDPASCRHIDCRARP